MALQDYINNLGKTGVDTITGFKGTIMVVSQSTNGMVRYALTPKIGKDGKYPESVDLDVERVKVTGRAAKLNFPAAINVALGDEVESLVHKFVGMVTDTHWHINGCVTLAVSGEVNKDGKVPSKFCNYAEVRVTKKQKLKVDSNVGDRPPGNAFGRPFNDSASYR